MNAFFFLYHFYFSFPALLLFWPCRTSWVSDISHLSLYFELSVKLFFTTMCFVGFYSVPNLIVILFNLLYSVCIVGFHCKGCVKEKVVWRLKHLKTKEGFTSIPRSISCALHVLECEESGQMETAVSREYLVGKAFPWDIREALARHCFAILSSLIHTFCAYYLYSYYPQMWGELLRENPSQTT